tara:strand:- start:142 stop:369 length:228 start_codon:yes stop_codon:yes gene_type:complete
LRSFDVYIHQLKTHLDGDGQLSEQEYGGLVERFEQRVTGLIVAKNPGAQVFFVESTDPNPPWIEEIVLEVLKEST